MQYLLILVPCLLATAKMVIHGQFGKRNVKTVTDAAFFYFAIFLAAFLIFSYRLPAATGLCWIFAAIFGMAVMHLKGVFPQEFGTFLHITLNAADDPVVFTDVKDFFHSACSR